MEFLISLLSGLLTNGVYYVAQQFRDKLKEDQKRTLQTEDEIQSSLTTALKDLLPKISKKLPQIESLNRPQRQALEALITRENELLYWIRKTIVDKLVMLPPIGHDSYIDVFSVEEIAGVIQKIQKTQPIKDLDPETIKVFIPNLIVLLLQGLGAHPAMEKTMAMIRSIHSFRLQHDLHDVLTLDDEEKQNAIQSARQTLYSIPLVNRLINKELLRCSIFLFSVQNL